jgi:hypothetical protein
MPFHVWLVIIHPVLVTILVIGILIHLLDHTRFWRPYKWPTLAGLCLLYAIDTAFAIPRIAYGWQSPDRALVHQTIPLPRSLVMIHTGCGTECQRLLVDGELDEVILVEQNFSRPGEDLPPVRYRAGWSEPETCPRERLTGHGMIADGLLRRGFCPVIEAADVPANGIFVVQESFRVAANRRAARFTSKHLTSSPPGPVIEFFATEVQSRSNGKIEVLATRRLYSAQGLTGLPPLIGCWARPDNVIWIMPPGDTGCGFWRWFTGGGDRNWTDRDSSWVFAKVFRRHEGAAKAPQ